MHITNRAATLNLIYRNVNILSGRMRREVILLVVVIIIAGAALWLWYRPGQENPPVTKCPSTCKYGCLPGTTTCREPPPLTCPAQCKLGCISGTTECKPEVIPPKKNLLSECGTINDTVELNASIRSEKTCLIIQNNNLTLDCKGHSITGSRKNDSYAVQLIGRNNVTIKNCVIQNYTSGIVVDSSSKISLSNITVNNNLEDGISVNSSSYTLVEGISASRNGGYGVQIISSSNTTLLSSKFGNNMYGVYIQSSNSTGLLNNLICSSLILDVKCYDPDIVVDKSNLCGRKACNLNCSRC
jgi:hypothetical protein